MASYSVNKRAVAHARRLIRSRQYVLDSDWGEAQPKAAAENAYPPLHSWDEYAEWHLGLTDGAADETKARYAFVYGDLRRLHDGADRLPLPCAAEWRHKEIELAAHDLLQLLDEDERLSVLSRLRRSSQRRPCTTRGENDDEVHAPDPPGRHPDAGIGGVGPAVGGRAEGRLRRRTGDQPDAGRDAGRPDAAAGAGDDGPGRGRDAR